MAYKTMNDLMAEYRAQVAAKKWIDAHNTLVQGVESAHQPSKVLLARLYKDCTMLDIPQQERYARSEALYRSVLDLLDISDKLIATLCTELAELYSFMQRPVAVLAMLLRAKRYGADVPDREVDRARHLLMNLDINDFGKTASDAFELGLELYLANSSARLTEFFLQEACEKADNKLLRGKASLLLADFYNDRRHENYIYAGEAARYYRQAAEAGFPEYLSRHNGV